MTYDEIVEAIMSYSDRRDAETAGKIDTFLRVTEARTNKNLEVRQMSFRASIAMVVDQEYYGLPPDFNGLRDIEMSEGGGDKNRITLSYLSPEQMNDKNANNINYALSGIFYTIIANQIQIYPTQDDTKQMEIVYFKTLTPLDSVNTTNWLSESSPDCYIFGALVELSAWTKDPTSLQIWDTRFKECLNDITVQDASQRWSGTSLRVRSHV